MASQSVTYEHPCLYCTQEHYLQMHTGGNSQKLRGSEGYLLYRVGNGPEIVAQSLCKEHRDQKWDHELPASARRVWCP